MPDQLTTTDPTPIIEPLATHQVPIDEFLFALWPIQLDPTNQAPSQMHFATATAMTNLWDLFLFYLPELIMFPFIILGFIIIFRFYKQRKKIHEVNIGETYCKNCGYIILPQSIPSPCPECNKNLNHKNTRKRSRFYESYPRLLTLLTLTWGTAFAILTALTVSYFVQGQKTSFHPIAFISGQWRWDSSLTLKGRYKNAYQIPFKIPISLSLKLSALYNNLFFQQCGLFKVQLKSIDYNPKTQTITTNKLASFYHSPIYSTDRLGKSWLLTDTFPSQFTPPHMTNFDTGYILSIAGNILYYDKSTKNITTIKLKNAKRFPAHTLIGKGIPPTTNPGGTYYDRHGLKAYQSDNLIILTNVIRAHYFLSKHHEIPNAAGVDRWFKQIALIDKQNKQLVSDEIYPLFNIQGRYVPQSTLTSNNYNLTINHGKVEYVEHTVKKGQYPYSILWHLPKTPLIINNTQTQTQNQPFTEKQDLLFNNFHNFKVGYNFNINSTSSLTIQPTSAASTLNPQANATNQNYLVLDIFNDTNSTISNNMILKLSKPQNPTPLSDQFLLSPQPQTNHLWLAYLHSTQPNNPSSYTRHIEIYDLTSQLPEPLPTPQNQKLESSPKQRKQ
ncbi:hypothetical protein JD969_11420 [Planctomycetota bacterium]|nr:hypothetical protein JD969_11420 [Planctomycetota bacterium]